MSKEKPRSRGPGKQNALKIDQNQPPGEYCNIAAIHHSRTEVVFDFVFRLGDTGRIASRVITNPSHAKALLTALEENIAKYEQKHGPIPPVGRDETPEMLH